MSPELLSALTVFVLAILVGFAVISKVPATLHTPLMSGANSIHGIVLVGSMFTVAINKRFVVVMFSPLSCQLHTGFPFSQNEKTPLLWFHATCVPLPPGNSLVSFGCFSEIVARDQKPIAARIRDRRLESVRAPPSPWLAISRCRNCTCSLTCWLQSPL